MKLLQIEEERKEGIESEMSPEKQTLNKPMDRDVSCNSLLSQIRAAGKKNGKIEEEKELSEQTNYIDKQPCDEDIDYGLLINHTPLKADKKQSRIIIAPSQ